MMLSELNPGTPQDFTPDRVVFEDYATGHSPYPDPSLADDYRVEDSSLGPDDQVEVSESFATDQEAAAPMQPGFPESQAAGGLDGEASNSNRAALAQDTGFGSPEAFPRADIHAGALQALPAVAEQTGTARHGSTGEREAAPATGSSRLVSQDHEDEASASPAEADGGNTGFPPGDLPPTGGNGDYYEPGEPDDHEQGAGQESEVGRIDKQLPPTMRTYSTTAQTLRGRPVVDLSLPDLTSDVPRAVHPEVEGGDDGVSPDNLLPAAGDDEGKTGNDDQSFELEDLPPEALEELSEEGTDAGQAEHAAARELQARYKRGDELAKTEVVERYQGLIHKLAHKLLSRSDTRALGEDDLFQEGVIAFFAGLKQWEPEGEDSGSLRAYAGAAAYRAMQRCIDNQGHQVHIPADIARMIRWVRAENDQRLKSSRPGKPRRPPMSDQEIAQQFGLRTDWHPKSRSVPLLRRAELLTRYMGSLDTGFDPGDEESPGNDYLLDISQPESVTGSAAAASDDEALDKVRDDAVREAIAQLPDTLRAVIQMRFAAQRQTLEEIGRAFGRDYKEWARQREATALRMLGRALVSWHKDI